MTCHLRNRTINRRLGVMVIAGVAATLTGAGVALAGPGVPISTCKYKITAPGNYVLVADLTCGVGANGIDIFSSNVTLDLNGHTITGPKIGGGAGGTGVVVSNNIFAPMPQIVNVHVQGPGLIQGFDNGMYLQAMSNSDIHDVVLMHNSFGIVTNFGVGDHFKTNVAAQNTTAGFDLRDNNDHVEMNTATGNGKPGDLFQGVGIEIQGNDNEVVNNITDGNPNSGIYIASGSNNRIHDNTTDGNTAYGIAIQGGAQGNDIHNNTALGNGSPTSPFFTGDLADGNLNCGSNTWHNDTFITAFQPCDN
jgi:parallel beta-helix repeat protein